MRLNFHKNKHKQLIPDEDHLEDRFTHCPFCGSVETKSIGMITNGISVMTCSHCHIGYIGRQPTEAFLKEFYAGYYRSSARHTTIEPGMLARHLILHFGKLSSKENYSILDFGGGDGSVSRIIADYLLTSDTARNVKICVVDYNGGEESST